VIGSFKHKGLREFFETGNSRKLSVQNSARVRRILLALDAATKAEQMDLPGFKFHALKGNLAGRYSVWATANYRITFAFDGEHATNVDLEDYHGK